MRLFKEVERDGRSIGDGGSLEWYSDFMLKGDARFRWTLSWLNTLGSGYSKLNLETAFLLANEVLDEEA